VRPALYTLGTPAVAHRQHSMPTAELMLPTHTTLSEPKTDAMVMRDTFGRVIQLHLPAHPEATSASATTTINNGSPQPAQPLPRTPPRRLSTTRAPVAKT